MDWSATVAVVTLGGTIACTSSPGDGVVPALDAGHMASVVRRAATGLPPVHLVQEPPLASAVLDTSSLVRLVVRLDRLVADGVRGVVVTTGTDTLEEVAFVLDLLWRHPEPLVLVGAMRHGGLLGADGPGNLRAGLRVAAHDQARGLGCLVAMDGALHQAWQVQKRHTSSLGAFESTVTGPVGSVFEDTVRLGVRAVIDRPLFTFGPGIVVPPVALLTASLADDGRLVGALEGLGYRGLVVEALGGGSVPPSWASPLETLAARMPVVFASRTGVGPLLRSTYGGVGSERDLCRRGLVPAGLLDGLKARLLLGCLLAGQAGPTEMHRAWEAFDSPTTGSGRQEIVGPIQ